MCAVSTKSPSRLPAPTISDPDALRRQGVTVRSSEDGRRELGLDLGRLGRVTVVESPAPALTDTEWSTILDARTAYQRMWGGGRQFQSLKEDPFDGRGAFARAYSTTHYIGSMATPGKPDKVITMRKVALNRYVLGLAGGETPPLVEDLSFWTVHDTQRGLDTPLAEVIKTRLEGWAGLGPCASVAQLPIAALSRAGTLPHASAGARDADDRNRSVVVYALMQVAAAQDDLAHALYAAQICEEFRTRVFALHLADHSRIELHYPPAARTLNLPDDRYRVVLDRANPVVRRMLWSFPGFWLDNTSLARVLIGLVDEGRVSPDQLRRAALRVLWSGDATQLGGRDTTRVSRLARGEHVSWSELHWFADLLARPRFAKYAAHSLLRGAEVRRRILAEVGDGPYSVLVQPQQLLESALRLLSLAADMYARDADDR